MTPKELHDFIAADPAAKALADAGNDAGCAAYCVANAPKVATESRWTYWGLESDAGIGVAATRRLIVSVQATATVDPLVAAMELSLTSPVETAGANVSDSGTQAMLDEFAAATMAGTTPSGLNAADATAIKALGLQPPIITHDDVSVAWAQYRAVSRQEVRNEDGTISVIETMGVAP